jgi:hypothetical protein
MKKLPSESSLHDPAVVEWPGGFCGFVDCGLLISDGARARGLLALWPGPGVRQRQQTARKTLARNSSAPSAGDGAGLTRIHPGL